MRALYTVLLRLALPFLLVRLWWRGRAEPGYRDAVTERFGIYRIDRAERLLWIHAVSVGEARAAEPLVRALGGSLPDHRILMTCTTAAGRENGAGAVANDRSGASRSTPRRGRVANSCSAQAHPN